MADDRTLSRARVAVSLAATALYWFWESRAAGNIRVDLLLIYPFLLSCYVATLWRKFRFWSVPIALVLMAINFVYFANSYRMFDKNPG